jgi:hypothetical protein
MSKIATSSSIYRRGVPNNYYQFGILVQGNYPIYQPSGTYLYSDFVKLDWLKNGLKNGLKNR